MKARITIFMNLWQNSVWQILKGMYFYFMILQPFFFYILETNICQKILILQSNIWTIKMGY